MKVSEYIAALQAIMDAEGDIDVVKTDPAYGAGAQGFGCGPADAPRVFRSGTLHGRQHILSQGGRDIASTGAVVCVSPPMSFGWAGGGGGGVAETFTFATGGSNGVGGAGGGSGGGWPETGKAVKFPGGMTFNLPSDMPETGIHLDINGKTSVVTKAELQRMIDAGELKV